MTFGGTIVAIAGKDFVVVGATRGASLGGMIMLSRKGLKRVYRVYDRVLIGYAGLYGSFQHINGILETHLKAEYYKYKIIPTVRRIANTLSTILYSDRFYFPNPIEAIIGGFNPDGSGPELYVVGGLGEIIREKYASAGDGFEIALAVLESEYSDDIEPDEAKRLAEKALKTAATRVLTNEPYLEPEVDIIIKNQISFLRRRAYFSRLYIITNDRGNRSLTYKGTPY